MAEKETWRGDRLGSSQLCSVFRCRYLFIPDYDVNCGKTGISRSSTYTRKRKRTQLRLNIALDYMLVTDLPYRCLWLLQF